MASSTQRGWWDSRVKGKGTPVLGSGIFPKNLRRLAILPNTFSVGDFSS
jgi:hypothetical protein